MDADKKINLWIDELHVKSKKHNPAANEAKRAAAESEQTYVVVENPLSNWYRKTHLVNVASVRCVMPPVVKVLENDRTGWKRRSTRYAHKRRWPPLKQYDRIRLSVTSYISGQHSAALCRFSMNTNNIKKYAPQACKSIAMRVRSRS